jgi:hypothetical protein
VSSLPPQNPTPGETLWRGLARAHRAALLLTALFCLTVAVRGAILGLRPKGNDFTIYFDAARALLAGRSPMEVEGWIYPPAGALFAVPFALLPYGPATCAWALASLCALAWSALTVARLLSAPGERAWPWLLWAPTALIARPIDSNFANGQINLLVFALVLLGLRTLARGRELRGAALLGAVTALKILPAIFLAQLAARRRFGAALAGGGVAVLLVLVPGLPLRGPAGVREDLARWWQDVLEPFARGGEDLHAVWPRAPGQSLTGVIYRLATDDPAQLVDRSRPAAAPSREALARARLWVRVGSALLLLLLFVPIVVRPAPLAERAWLGECALAASTALLIAPLVHKAHFVWLLLPLGVIVQTIFDERSTRARRWSAAVALALAGLLISGTAPALVGRREATYLLVYSAIFLGSVPQHLWLAADVWTRALARHRGR